MVRHEIAGRSRALFHAIRDGDQAEIEAAVLRVSRSRRWLAPLALTISTLALLLDGFRLIFSNWRLTLLQVLPAVWVWIAMFDFKIHVFHGRSTHLVMGWKAWLAMLLVAGITIGAFYVNAISAFAIMAPGGPSIPEGRQSARRNWRPIVLAGAVVGLALGWATIFAARHGRPWFALSLGISVGLLMLSYVSVPTRLLGTDTKAISRKDKLVSAAVTGAISGVAAAPAYVLSRVGILMLGTHALFIPGIFVTAVGFALEAGASSAVRAVKMSMKLLAGGKLEPATPATDPGAEPAIPAADPGAIPAADPGAIPAADPGAIPADPGAPPASDPGGEPSSPSRPI